MATPAPGTNTAPGIDLSLQGIAECQWVVKSHGSEKGLPMFPAHFSPQSSGNNLHEHMFKFTLKHEEHQVWTQSTNSTANLDHIQLDVLHLSKEKMFLFSHQKTKRKQVKLQKLNNSAPLTRRNKKVSSTNQMRIWGLYISWCRAVVESEQLLKLGSSFERPDHFWSAAEIIMRTTLIADDKSQSQRRIWLVQSCQGSSWRNKAAFCFSSKAFCLRFKEKKKLTLILHQNWSVIRSQIKLKKKMQLFWECWRFVTLLVRKDRKCKTLQWHIVEQRGLSLLWRPSVVRFTRSICNGQVCRAQRLYPIQNRPPFLLPWPVVTFQH